LDIAKIIKNQWFPKQKWQKEPPPSRNYLPDQ